MQSWYDRDGFDYLFSLLLDCPDTRARQSVARLLKYVLVSLKMQDKEHLWEAEDFEVEGDDGAKMTMQRYKSLCARFVARAIELLTTKVAKNWSRFDQFHDLLLTVALADVSEVLALFEVKDQAREGDQDQQVQPLSTSSPAARVGLELCFKLKFVEKACDFMLGKKSPLCQTGERRADVGGAYAHPDFSSVVKLMASMITDEDLLARYPMTAIEKEMLLHQDLLKTMLGSATGSKQFGQCAANMCRDDAKLTKKVAKVFLSSIEQAQADTVKGYLKALKPFLLADDSLKQQKLEWVFGVPEVASRKVYGESRHKYGLELVDRINEESMTFTSPILYGASDEALVAQIIRCKGRFEVQCISCLKELLSLMRKDRVVADFVYQLPPHTYQYARFADWFRPYLEEQLADQSKSSVATTQYFRNKHDLLVKALAHLDALEPVFAELETAQKEKLAKSLTGGPEAVELAKDWIGTNSSEVIQHYPVQLIVGKQVGEEREVFVHDEDPYVKVQVFEVDCEYAYSAPTGLFNLQVPHVELRASLYQTQSYEQFKRVQATEAAKQAAGDLGEGTEEQAASDKEEGVQKAGEEAAETTAEEKVEELALDSRPWEECKKQGPVLLRVVATNKTQDKDLKIWCKLAATNPSDPAGLNVTVPLSMRKAYLNAKNDKVVQTLLRSDPSKPFLIRSKDDIKIELEVKVRNGPGSNRRAGQGAGQGGGNFSVGVGAPSSNASDGDERGDDVAYAAYQGDAQYTGYEGHSGVEENLIGLLNLQPQHEDGRQSDDSTTAVHDENAAGASRHNSGDLAGFGVTGTAVTVECDACGARNDAAAFACGACGQYLGGGH